MNENEKMKRVMEILNSVTDYSSDIKQDVFIKIFEKVNLQKYPPETLLSLVRKMLKNEMIDQIRKQKMQYIDSDASEIDFLTSLPYEEYIDIPEKEIVLQNLLKSLNQKEQLIMTLTLGGKKNKDIAFQLNENINNIKSVKKRAIQKLKSKI